MVLGLALYFVDASVCDVIEVSIRRCGWIRVCVCVDAADIGGWVGVGVGNGWPGIGLGLGRVGFIDGVSIGDEILIK